jgi:hypothetical protein
LNNEKANKTEVFFRFLSADVQNCSDPFNHPSFPRTLPQPLTFITSLSTLCRSTPTTPLTSDLLQNHQTFNNQNSISKEIAREIFSASYGSSRVNISALP